jgi:MscS family membrane protein
MHRTRHARRRPDPGLDPPARQRCQDRASRRKRTPLAIMAWISGDRPLWPSDARMAGAQGVWASGFPMMSFLGRLGRHMRRLMAPGALWLGCALSAVADHPVDWSGDWDTMWRGGGARLNLTQEGRVVTGDFPLFDGRVEAQVDGRTLQGTWRSANGEGRFIFVQSRDGDSFAGRYASGEWWTGARTLDSEADEGRLAQWSPAETVENFLRTMNAVGPASTSLLGVAAGLLLPVDEAETGISRIDHANLLFKALDRMTLRMWDLPSGEGVTSLTVEVAQAGTDVTFPLELRRIGVRWYIVPPPEAELLALQQRLDTARARSLPEIPLPDPARASPRATMRSFIVGLVQEPSNPSDEVISTLDLSELPPALHGREGPLLARFLKMTLDRVGFVIWQELPDDPGSETPYVHFQHSVGDIVIAPVETEDGIIWQFTPDTLRNIRRLYAVMDDIPPAPGVVAAEPDAFFRARALIRQTNPALLAGVGPMEAWQWLGLSLMALLSGGLGFLTGRIAPRLEGRVPARTPSAAGQPLAGPDSAASLGTKTILVCAAIGTAVLLGDSVLAVPDEVGRFTATLAWMLLILAGTILSGQVIDWLVKHWASSERVDQRELTIIDLVRRVARIGVYLLGLILVAQVLDIPWQGLVAGLSIGGVAVALAVQPALGNLFSGITLYSDRPIKVGDFCRFGDTMGTVENIGLRSTRIRTLDRTLVTIPNAEFANMQIENYAQRDRIWLQTTLQLRYETTEDQLRFVLVELRKLLIAHPRISAEPARVRFAGFGEHSLDIEIFTYVLTSDVAEFQEVREDVLLRIIALVDRAGAQFAFPAAVQYRAEDTPPDADRVRAAEAEVERMRNENALPFPDFDWREKAELSGTLDYPPTHSALAETRGRST